MTDATTDRPMPDLNPATHQHGIELNSTLAGRLLDTIERDILPLTEQAVARGNKLFGAALLRKKDLTTFLAATNDEMRDPLMHGEMHTLQAYHALPEADRLPPSELIFLSTHEPCSLCLSAITWSGFDNFFYLFSHVESRDSFAIPHDLAILKEVFGVEPGEYRQHNAFWSSHSIASIVDLINDDQAAPIKRQEHAIRERYDTVSTLYQSGKATNSIPLN